MIRIDMKVGESIRIGDATITLDDKSGKVARLSIEAPRTVPIERVRQQTIANHVAKMGMAPMPA